MTLPREEVLTGFTEELGRFEALVRSLDERELAHPSRCEGWSVGDVAAHVIGGLADVTSGRFEGLGTPEVTQRQVTERRGRSPQDLADELQHVAKAGNDILAGIDDEAWRGDAPGGLPGTVGEGVEALWYDTYVHAEDIRAGAGRAPQPGPGLRASVAHLADLLSTASWGPATLALDGLEEFPVSGGGGRRVTGDPLRFVLVATGRADPAELGLDEAVNVYR